VNAADAERLAIAIRALQWYANPDHYHEDDWGFNAVLNSPDYADPGGKARRALERIQRMRG